MKANVSSRLYLINSVTFTTQTADFFVHFFTGYTTARNITKRRPNVLHFIREITDNLATSFPKCLAQPQHTLAIKNTQSSLIGKE